MAYFEYKVRPSFQRMTVTNFSNFFSGLARDAQSQTVLNRLVLSCIALCGFTSGRIARALENHSQLRKPNHRIRRFRKSSLLRFDSLHRPISPQSDLRVLEPGDWEGHRQGCAKATKGEGIHGREMVLSSGVTGYRRLRRKKKPETMPWDTPIQLQPNNYAIFFLWRVVTGFSHFYIYIYLSIYTPIYTSHY